MIDEAGGERRSWMARRLAFAMSRASEVAFNLRSYERMRAAEHAPRDPSRVFERRHGLAEIVERGAVSL